jgi:hypothetical protein
MRDVVCIDHVKTILKLIFNIVNFLIVAQEKQGVLDSLLGVILDVLLVYLEGCDFTARHFEDFLILELANGSRLGLYLHEHLRVRLVGAIVDFLVVASQDLSSYHFIIADYLPDYGMGLSSIIELTSRQRFLQLLLLLSLIILGIVSSDECHLCDTIGELHNQTKRGLVSNAVRHQLAILNVVHIEALPGHPHIFMLFVLQGCDVKARIAHEKLSWLYFARALICLDA